MSQGAEKTALMPEEALTSTKMKPKAKPFPAGVKLVICTGLSICAFMARTPVLLLVLILLNAAALRGFRKGPVTLGREWRVLVWQTLIITCLYMLRFGFKAGVIPGILISVQLFLSFFPGVIFIQTTPRSRIMASFCKIMPERIAFVLAMCLKFIPILVGEVKAIHEAQVFRGARILPKDLLNPANWPELMHCLLFPAVVHCMVAANEIATAAKARDFGKHPKRTHWPEE